MGTVHTKIKLVDLVAAVLGGNIAEVQEILGLSLEGPIDSLNGAQRADLRALLTAYAPEGSGMVGRVLTASSSDGTRVPSGATALMAPLVSTSPESLPMFRYMVDVVARSAADEEHPLVDILSAPNSTDPDLIYPGRTPATMAAMEGKLPFLEVLHQAEPAALNVPDARGDTPLHVAAQGAEHWLFEHGADPLAKNAQGQTPYQARGGITLGLAEAVALRDAERVEFILSGPTIFRQGLASLRKFFHIATWNDTMLSHEWDSQNSIPLSTIRALRDRLAQEYQEAQRSGDSNFNPQTWGRIGRALDAEIAEIQERTGLSPQASRSHPRGPVMA